MILLTSFYHDADANRRGELLECPRRNAAVERLAEMHVFIEDAMTTEELKSHAEFTSGKVRMIAHDRRNVPGSSTTPTGSCSSLMQTFSSMTLCRISKATTFRENCCAFRWDAQSDGSASFFEHAGSQDAWIVKAPIREFRCDFQLGMPAYGLGNRSGRAEAFNPHPLLRMKHI